MEVYLVSVKVLSIEKISLSVLQNRRLTLLEFHVATGRLHVLARIKGSSHFNFIEWKLQENGTLSLVRELVQVSLPVLWLRFITEDFYKTFKNSIANIEEAEYHNNDIPRRHASSRQFNRGGVNGEKHSNLIVATSGHTEVLR